MITIDIPADVRYIIEKLRSAGYEAYAVGGCVRDSLLGKTPKDWDITTSAFPEDVKCLFTRTIDTGIKHGTVTVLLNGTGYEVTTYRIDGEYLDGRHPEEVSFTSNLDEDLKRRDFTINAFVYNEAEGVKDLFGGLDDLKNGIIRCVGDPLLRFGEDALRILRAVRFAAVLSFDIEKATYDAAAELAGNLSKVSAERIKTELEKTLTSSNPDYILMLHDLGIDRVILKELAAVKSYRELKDSLKKSKAEASVRWAVLCYYIKKDARLKPASVKSILSGLKFDNRTSDKIMLFLDTVENCIKGDFDRNHKQPRHETDSGTLHMETYQDYGNICGSDNSQDSYRYFCRRILNIIGEEYIYDFADFCRSVLENRNPDTVYRRNVEDVSGVALICDTDGTAGTIAAPNTYDEIQAFIDGRFESTVRDILEKKECFSLKMLSVNGKDLLNEKIAEGKELGNILEYLLELVMESPERNEREYLLNAARAYGHREV